MITLFNRKLLTVAYSMQQMVRLREALSDAGIESTVRTPGLGATADRRARTGSFGVPEDRMYQYNIYVHKDEHGKALRAISGTLRGGN